MRVFVEAVGVLAPGLPDWEGTKSVLAGEQPFSAAPLAPVAPTSLAPAERRRSSPTVRLAIAAAEQAMRRSSLAPHEMAMVFSSREAAGDITHQLCEVLAGSREVSPTQFHNSVHNAPSGYYSIAMNAKLAASSVCRGKWSFAAGLLNAAAQALTDKVPVLYVCYDSPLPAPLCDVMPINRDHCDCAGADARACAGIHGAMGDRSRPGRRGSGLARLDARDLACQCQRARVHGADHAG